MLAGLDRHLKDTYGPTHPLFRCEVRREEAILQPAALQLSLVCDMFDSKAVMQQVGRQSLICINIVWRLGSMGITHAHWKFDTDMKQMLEGCRFGV